MAYKKTYAKFGNRTTAQIAAGLPGQQIGDTVFNTDYKQIEVFNGTVWTNSNSVVVTAGTTITQGQLLKINSSGKAVLLTNASGDYPSAVGVCQYGGVLDSQIVVRINGLAKCLVGGAISVGQYALPSSTAGRIAGQGSSPSNGTLGRIVEFQPSGSLAFVFLTFIERA